MCWVFKIMAGLARNQESSEQKQPSKQRTRKVTRRGDPKQEIEKNPIRAPQHSDPYYAERDTHAGQRAHRATTLREKHHLRYLPGPIPEQVSEEDRRIPVRDGAEITVRIYRPVTGTEGVDSVSRPLIVMYHEGGFSMGDLSDEETNCRLFSRDLGAVCVNVEYRYVEEARAFLDEEERTGTERCYPTSNISSLRIYFCFTFLFCLVILPFPLVLSIIRLAPEYPFPTWINDCWDALQWVSAYSHPLLPLSFQSCPTTRLGYLHLVHGVHGRHGFWAFTYSNPGHIHLVVVIILIYNLLLPHSYL
jgi:hypothetical protein